MELDALDGYYRVIFASDFPLPEGAYEIERADIVIRRGVMAGVDAGGATFTGKVTILGTDACRVEAILDPRTGDPDMIMMQDDGSVARKPVSRQANFKIRELDGRIVLHGSSKLGPYEWSIQVERTGLLDYENGR